MNDFCQMIARNVGRSSEDSALSSNDREIKTQNLPRDGEK